MKTTKTFNESTIKREWYLIDAKGKTLGHLAVVIANILRGKDKVVFSPNFDLGDYVVVINAKDIVVSGQKEIQKMYYFHSWYPGGLKKFSFAQMMGKDPKKVLHLAVKRMLPKNKLAEKIIKKLKIYNDEKHSYKNQKFKII